MSSLLQIDPKECVATLLKLLGAQAVATPEAARKRLREVLTVVPAGRIPSQAWPYLEALCTTERAARSATTAAELPRLSASGPGARVSLWRGDITTLHLDAIVNAANSGMTGCYQPLHACVDNAIHTAAGPWLREECAALMTQRGRPEPTATATVTGGYFLPARHVVHTVGPIVSGGAPTTADARALARCYRVCLEAAAAAGATSIAFCSISTGVFGYPVAAAVPLVLATVREELAAGLPLSQVVFVTFSKADESIYAAHAPEVFRG